MHPLAALLAVLPVIVAVTAMTVHGYRLVAPARSPAPAPPVVAAPAPVVHDVTAAQIVDELIVAAMPTPMPTSPTLREPSRRFPSEQIAFARTLEPVTKKGFALGRAPTQLSAFADDDDDDTTVVARVPSIHEMPTRIVRIRAQARR